MSQPTQASIHPDSDADATVGATFSGSAASRAVRRKSQWMPPNSDPLPVLDAEDEHEQNPVRWRELLSCLLIVVSCDLTIYRGQGFAGLAALFVIGPLLLLVGVSRLKLDASVWVIAPMLLLSAVRLLWCGSWLNVVVGFPLLAGFAMSLAGLRPYMLDLLAFGVQSIFFGFGGVSAYRRAMLRVVPSFFRANWMTIGLPLLAFVVFSLLFLAANPDLWTSFENSFSRLFNILQQWLSEFSPSISEVLFWLLTGCVAIGWLRPATEFLLSRIASQNEMPNDKAEKSVAAPAPLFAAFRNTLVALIALFAVYLAFEFQTLWFRVFPQGFHYSGYAHEGAAWLTVALALATVVLSVKTVAIKVF